jgi:uncharacterized protein (DUF1778 family)
MGRPEFPESEKRNTFIMVRLTQDEKEQIKAAAKEEMRTASDYARTVLLNEIKKAQ